MHWTGTHHFKECTGLICTVLNGAKQKMIKEKSLEYNCQMWGDRGLYWQGNSPKEQFCSGNLEKLANRIQLQNPSFRILTRRFCAMLPRQHSGNWRLGTTSCCLETTLIISSPYMIVVGSTSQKYIIVSAPNYDSHFLHLIQWYTFVCIALIKNLYNHYSYVELHNNSMF